MDSRRRRRRPHQVARRDAAASPSATWDQARTARGAGARAQYDAALERRASRRAAWLAAAQAQAGLAAKAMSDASHPRALRRRGGRAAHLAGRVRADRAGAWRWSCTTTRSACGSTCPRPTPAAVAVGQEVIVSVSRLPGRAVPRHGQARGRERARRSRARCPSRPRCRTTTAGLKPGFFARAEHPARRWRRCPRSWCRAAAIGSTGTALARVRAARQPRGRAARHCRPGGGRPRRDPRRRDRRGRGRGRRTSTELADGAEVGVRP